MDGDRTSLVEERFARLTRLAARGFNRALQIRLARYGISFGQWTFLRILWAGDGQSQRELSQLAGVTEPTTHAALQRLEGLGLVTRRNLPGNNRRLHVFLTERGLELRGELEPKAVEVNEVALDRLPAEERRILRSALLHIIGNLQRDEEAAAARGVRMPPTRSPSEDI
ncbi:MarR family transcriptional regulator [Aquicoccus sp. SCR17]|nr:MarR family transcriptional regulator [Carideicomes alvinocaridis]